MSDRGDDYDAIALEIANIRALADLVEAIFIGDGDLNLELAGPGVAAIAKCITEKLDVIRTHADRLFEQTPAPREGGAR